MALNNCQWPSERVTPKKQSIVHELDVFNNLAIQASLLTNQLQSTQPKNTQGVENVTKEPSPPCDFCNRPILVLNVKWEILVGK